MGGYAGQILYIDLTSGDIKKKALDTDFARDNIGGLGFITRLYIDLIKKGPAPDPLSPDNPFIIMTGPLTGMKLNGVARWAVGTRSPLTGFWGDSNTGGYFGSSLKFAGYDGMVITGKSEKPVYIHINDKTVEIRDAAVYWGLDVYDTTDRMTEALKPESTKPGHVLCIGPAGENLVKFASLLNHKGYACGRTGMGAVWGSKNLKAIYATGTNRVEPADPDRLKALRDELKTVYEESIFIDAIHASGTPAHIDVGIIGGDIPIKNYSENQWEDIDDIGPSAIEEKIHTGHRTCYGCGVACKKNAEVKNGPFSMENGPGPEYETVVAFGAMCLNKDIESIAKANEICNRYGMDTITCGSTIAFAIECFENGLIDESTTDGIRLNWGNAEAIVAMTEKIGRQEGFGAVLALGSATAAKKIGKGAERFLTTVKGLEAPMHDPRGFHGYGLAYGVSPRGACHEASLTFEVEGGAMYVPEIEILAEDYEEHSSEGRAVLNAAAEDYGMFFSNCAIFCNLGAVPLNATQTVGIVNAVTGFNYSLDEVLTIGKRVWYAKRGLTNLFGARAADDHLPARLMTPINDGPTEGSIPDMNKMLSEFYALRGFNENGVPKRGVLESMDLADLAELLYGE
ncbi:MAG: aldehyde ferredoxin oxidoreductase family protein [Deltaproteobacteria bacterium]|nr:aldehyde ferredoxin oxidoreductase family protein [Deltaproteobacteria bacterium]